jgi:uncharacterized NAD(P)/FAD-binding protein YdhS
VTTVSRRSRPTVVVVGAGAAGVLAAIHLARGAGRRSTDIDIVLIDPSDRLGRGVAYSTDDEQHLLNVQAAGMSALPEDPSHFVAWRKRDQPESPSDPAAFATRRQYGRYLDETLRDALEAGHGSAGLRQLRTRAVGVRRAATGVAVQTSDGNELTAEAIVIAVGLPSPGVGWAPHELLSSAFFVPDPWARGALDVVRRDRRGPADVLLVGTGLTTVDVALSVTDPSTRPDRVVQALSRGGRLPAEHKPEIRLAAIPDISDWGHDLGEIRRHARRHLASVARTTGDWRPGVDGLRFQVSALWERLSEADRAEFMTRYATRWSSVRHRMAPASALVLRELRAAGRLTVGRGQVVSAEPLSAGGLRVGLSDGTQRDVGWVVNCTGPRTDVRNLGDPLIDDLLRSRGGSTLAVVSTAGLGLETHNGRLLDSEGASDAPVWTLGAMRRGELWESTAVPELRSQAFALAQAVLDEVAPLPRQLPDGRVVGGRHPVARPRDPLGMPLSTTAEAAGAYNAGLERVMRLQNGGDQLIKQAAELDPDFALAHAALAMLGHEAGADADVRSCLESAREAVRKRGDDRERSLVDVVGQRVHDTRDSGARALMAHISSYPRDVLAVSAAVPTIAFSGVTDIQQEAWELVEGLAPAYGDHWWYISLLAFTRQDQSRFDDAGMLAESALSCEPSSGHAVHAQTHVMYETGQHEDGRVWLDHWVTESGRSASHRAHFSWHAALHELSLGDTEAVRKRYYSQLAPPAVTGVRSLIDAASLLWRWKVALTDWDGAVASGLPDRTGAAFSGEPAPPPIEAVLSAVDGSLVDQPETPFVAMHAAIGLAAAGDVTRLSRLRTHCTSASDAPMRTIVVPVCDAMIAAVEERWHDAWRLLVDVYPVLMRVGGSYAQREVIEETLLFSLVCAGEAERALALLDERLDRRPSPLDARRRLSLEPLPAVVTR